jgi:hypothetical protein
MKNTEILKNKLLQLQSEVNANPLHNIEFKQQKKSKKKYEFCRWQWKNIYTALS